MGRSSSCCHGTSLWSMQMSKYRDSSANTCTSIPVTRPYRPTYRARPIGSCLERTLWMELCVRGRKRKSWPLCTMHPPYLCDNTHGWRDVTISGISCQLPLSSFYTIFNRCAISYTFVGDSAAKSRALFIPCFISTTGSYDVRQSRSIHYLSDVITRE